MEQSLNYLGLKALPKAQPLNKPFNGLAVILVERDGGSTSYAVAKWDEAAKKPSVVYDPDSLRMIKGFVEVYYADNVTILDPAVKVEKKEEKEVDVERVEPQAEATPVAKEDESSKEEKPIIRNKGGRPRKVVEA